MIEYFEMRLGEFDKNERDLIAVSVKKMVERERKAIKLYTHLTEQSRLKRFEQNIKTYTEKLREELRTVLQEIVELLKKNCLQQAKNVESKVFFLNLIGDFYRYQIDTIIVDDQTPFE